MLGLDLVEAVRDKELEKGPSQRRNSSNIEAERNPGCTLRSGNAVESGTEGTW